MKNFDFDNETSENIFLHPYISYIANERLQAQKQFHSKSYLLEMHLIHWFWEIELISKKTWRYRKEKMVKVKNWLMYYRKVI